MCLRPKPSAGIWRHEAKRRMPRGAQKATAINRRRNTTSPMSKRIRRQMTKDGRSKGSLNKGYVLDIDRIKAKSLGSAIFKIGSSAGTKDLIFKWRREMRLLRRLGINYPWWPRAKGLIESPYEPVCSHNTVPPWEVQTGSRCVMSKSTRILWWIA